MRRYLSHHIIVDGVRYDTLSIVTIGDDNTVSVEPYEMEVHSTVYVNGTVVVNTNDDGRVSVSIINQ
jgi:hypothetical protein